MSEQQEKIMDSSNKSGGRGRLHHVTFNVESREAVLRAAEVFLDNQVNIEIAPSKHAPDWEPITWNQQERAKGQAWGNATVATFLTYGTPVIKG